MPGRLSGTLGLALACFGLPALRADVPPQSRSTNLRHGQAQRQGLPLPEDRIEGRQLQVGASVYKSFDLQFVYKVKPGAPFDSIFDERAITEIARLERRIRSLPAWREACSRTTTPTRPLCNIGISFANYALASQQKAAPGAAPSALSFDGHGQEVLPWAVTLGLVERHGLIGNLLPANMTAVRSGEVRMLRTMFRFRYICCTDMDPASYREPVMLQLKEDWGQFYMDVLASAFSSILESNAFFDIQYLGSGVPGHGVDSCLFTDPFLPDNQVFDAFFQPPPSSEPVCLQQGFQRITSASSCPVVWCEASHRNASVQSSNNCSCFRHERSSCAGHETANVTVRLVAPRHLSLGQMQDIALAHGQHIALDGNGTAWSTGHLPTPVALHEEVGLAAGMVTEVSWLQRREAVNSSCGWTDVCFCGASMCEMSRDPGWAPVPPLHLEQFNYSEVPDGNEDRENVYVVWGLEANDMAGFNAMHWGQSRSSSMSLRFLDSFVPALPQAQRDIFSFCQNLPQDLLVRDKRCWVEDFREWLKSSDERYPVPMADFHGAALNFSSSGATDSSRSRNYLWMNNGTVRAFFASFSVSVTRCLTGDGAVAYKQKWDDYLALWNRDAHRNARGAWHTSRLWAQIQYSQQPAQGQDQNVRLSGGARPSPSSAWAALPLALVGLLAGPRRPWRQ